MVKTKILFFLALIILPLSKIWAQASQSPYTIKGIGDLYQGGLIHNQGMAGLSASNITLWNINNVNPALLPRTQFSMFEVGVLSEYRTISNDSLKSSNGGVNLNYVAFALPLKLNKLGISFGVKPLSYVNYSIVTNTQIEDTEVDVETEYRGNGGLNELFLSAGYAFNKNFSVGASVSYLFGQIIRSNVFFIDDEEVTSNYKTAYQLRNSYSDAIFAAGLAYKAELKEGNFLNLGLKYDFSSNINTKKFERLVRYTITDEIIADDTIQNDIKGNTVLPMGFKAGISYEKRNKWLVGADFNYKDWAAYRDFKGSNEGLRVGYSFVLGAELTPNVNATKGYFKRVSYRIGFSYEKSPFVVYNEELEDFGMNFGLSLPVNKFSRINLAFRYGQRGSNKQILIKEQYFKLFFGITINDRWFVRPKYE